MQFDSTANYKKGFIHIGLVYTGKWNNYTQLKHLPGMLHQQRHSSINYSATIILVSFPE